MGPIARLLAGLALGIAASWTILALDVDKLRLAYFKVLATAPQERFTAWVALLSTARSLPVSDKLARVNDFFNRRVLFVDDLEFWGQTDYWATPMQTLARGAGDCEDFAIAKYFTLLSMGVPVEKMRLTYVRARIGSPSEPVLQAHMVLAYYPDPEADPQVLDNLVGTIMPASRRPDLLPVFTFNSEHIFQPGGKGTGQVSQLSRWQDALNRARSDGFD